MTMHSGAIGVGDPLVSAVKFDKDLDVFIIRAHSHLDKLQDMINTLPLVDARGESECPFARELYARKDEELEKAVCSLKSAEEYGLKIEPELARRRRDQETVSRNVGRLHLRESREGFREAERQQSALCDHLLQLRERLRSLIKRIREVIERGKARTMKSGGAP